MKYKLSFILATMALLMVAYKSEAQVTPNNLPPTNNCGESNEEICIETSGMGVQAYRQSLFGNLNLSPAEVPSGALKV